VFFVTADMRFPTLLVTKLCFQKLWDSGIGLSAWLVRLSIVDASVCAASNTTSSSSEVSRPSIVRELKETLFVREKCHVIELGTVSPHLLHLRIGGGPPLAASNCDTLRVLGAGTGIVSLVLAALRSADPTTGSESATASSHHETRILSTDLRESPLFCF
jgi:hypothetical protein